MIAPSRRATVPGFRRLANSARSSGSGQRTRLVSNAFGAAAGYSGIVQYASELEDQLTLPNRGGLRTRPLRRYEDRAVRELYRHLSTRTRYLRFSSAMPELPDCLLRLITCVDYNRRLALLAESDTDIRGSCNPS